MRENNEFFHLGSEGVCVTPASQGDVHSLRKRLIRKCQPCVCALCVWNNNAFDVTMTARSPTILAEPSLDRQSIDFEEVKKIMSYCSRVLKECGSHPCTQVSLP